MTSTRGNTTSLEAKWVKYGPTNDAIQNAVFHLARFNYIFPKAQPMRIFPPLGFEAGKEEISAILFLVQNGYLYLGTPEALPTDTLGENVQKPLPGHAPASRS